MPPKSTNTDEVLDVLRVEDGPPVRNAARVAEALNVSKPTAQSYLDDLVEEGRAEKGKISQTNVYWPTGHTSRGGTLKVVTRDAVVGAIRQADKPFATTTDIAEHLDVSDQTIRNNASELAEDPRIRKGKAGQSSIYWIKNDEHDIDIDP